jgi:hypothetical protein
MDADPESSTNIEAIGSPDDATSTSSNAGTSAGRNGEDDEQRKTKRRRVTLDGTPAVVVPATPPAPAAPTAARSVNKIIVEDLCSDDERTIGNALKDLWLWLIHLDFRCDDFQDIKDEFIKYGGHLAVSWIMEKHLNCKEIQWGGIGVVLRASYRDRKNIRMQLGETKCMHAFWSAMRRFQHKTHTF